MHYAEDRVALDERDVHLHRVFSHVRSLDHLGPWSCQREVSGGDVNTNVPEWSGEGCGTAHGDTVEGVAMGCSNDYYRLYVILDLIACPVRHCCGWPRVLVSSVRRDHGLDTDSLICRVGVGQGPIHAAGQFRWIGWVE